MPTSARIKALQKLLPSLEVDALLITNLTDLFYLTGMSVSVGELIVTKRGARLFVDGRYLEKCSKGAPCSVTLWTPEAMEKHLSKMPLAKKILGFDSTDLSYNNYIALRRHVNTAGRQRNVRFTLKALEKPLKALRTIKDGQEITMMRKAAKLGCQGYDHVVGLLREGISEKELAKALEIFWLEKGADGVSFSPIIAFGANSSIVHYDPGTAKLKKGQNVLIDIGVKVGHYCSDMTRVVFFGKPKRRLLETYHIVKEAQSAALALCKAGTPIGELDDAARAVIDKAGCAKLFPHGLGHGVGLDIHEHPPIKRMPSTEGLVLEEGMIITIEPGIYLPGKGGIRIEDTIVITERGHTNLSQVTKDVVIV